MRSTNIFKSKSSLFNHMLKKELSYLKIQLKYTGHFIDRIKYINSLLDQLESFAASGIEVDTYISLEIVKIRNYYIDSVKKTIEEN